MAIRRLNYTGRRKITRDDLSIALHEKPNAPATFDADLTQLAQYRLPNDAAVSVEARLQTRWMRFSYGTIGAIVPAEDRALTEFDSADGLQFSVKVTAVSTDPGKLLAEADRIPVILPGDVDEKRNPLLPVKSHDLGQEVYRLDFSGDEPILLINRAAGDKDAIARSPVFMSIVYPAALREILNRIIHVEGKGDLDDDEDSWCSRWLKFARSLPGIGAIPDADDSEAWIDDVVASFAKKQAMLEKFLASSGQKGEL